MEDKLKEYLSENNLNIFEPHSGHEDRFLRKLERETVQKKHFSWKWLPVAASILLVLGFYLGSNHQKNQYDMTDISPKMAETQHFFISTINQELKEIEQYRNINTEHIIEDALDQIEELEDKYNNFKKDLKHIGNEHEVIQGMIANYQQRLKVLEHLLFQLELLKKPTKYNNEFDEVI